MLGQGNCPMKAWAYIGPMLTDYESLQASSCVKFKFDKSCCVTQNIDYAECVHAFGVRSQHLIDKHLINNLWLNVFAKVV